METDELAARARRARAAIDDARAEYHRRCAAVVADEMARGDVHGAQRRAAARIGISYQYLNKILKLIETVG